MQFFTTKVIWFVIFFSAVSFIGGCQSNRQEAPALDQKTAFCQQYDWQKIGDIAMQHLSAELQAAFVMQGLSMNYHTAAGAYQIIGDVTDPDTRLLLQKIIDYDCA